METGTMRILDRSNAVMTCSAEGAADIGFFVRDLDIVLHTPRNCAYIMSSFHDRMFSNEHTERIGPFDPSEIRLFSTDLTDEDTIFGGGEKLRSLVESRIAAGSKHIMVITTCAAGIIGDDAEAVCRGLSAKHRDVAIIPVICDGNMTGHMGEGLRLATSALIGCVDPDVEPVPGSVNIMSPSFTKMAFKDKREELDRILGLMGLRVNCMFIGGCSMNDIVNLRRGSINLILTDSAHTREIAEEVFDRTGIGYFDKPAPIGLDRTVEWMHDLGGILGIDPDVTDRAAKELNRTYRESMEGLRGRLAGKRIGIYCDAPKDIRWLTDFLNDLGAVVVFAGFAPAQSSRPRRPNVTEGVPIMNGYETQELAEDLRNDSLDMLISHCNLVKTLACHHADMREPGIGVRGLLDYGRYLSNCMVLPQREGWR